jgi:hypothetical protein
VGSDFEPRLRVANFDCAERRTGTLALVNIKGLGASPADVQITNAELSQVGTNVTEMLFNMSDGAINLKPKVYDAPQSVTDEVKENYERGADGAMCIERDGDHVPSRAAVHHMPELAEARDVIAFGGTSCAIEYYDQGAKVTSRAGGTAHANRASRLADIYINHQNPDRAEFIKEETSVTLHEGLHLKGLEHLSSIACADERGMGVEAPIDLSRYIQNVLTDPMCTYSEYGGYDNIMGSNSASPRRAEANRYAKHRVSGVQADFISGREPSDPKASTVLADGPGNYRIEVRDSKEAKPYTALIPLDKPIEVSKGGEEWEYSNIALDYKSPRSGKHFLRVYLTNDTNDDTLKLLDVGSALILKEGRTLTIEDKTLAITRPDHGVMDIAVTEKR